MTESPKKVDALDIETPAADSRSIPVRREPDFEGHLVRALIASGTVDLAMVSEARAVQERTGEPLHRILLALRHLSEETLGAAIAQEADLPFSTKLSPAAEAATSLPVALCLIHRILPLRITDGTLVVAMADPLDERALRALTGGTSLKLEIVASTDRAVDAGLAELFSATCIDIATHALRRDYPESSAAPTLDRPQRMILVGLLLALVVGAAVGPLETVIALATASIAFQLASSLYKLVLILWAARNPPEVAVTDDELANVDERTLPRYTILVPLYHEADILPDLVDALTALDYPQTKLDVKLLCEPDDRGTIAVAEGLRLGPQFQILVVPESQPKTKPKACNYGVLWARGELVVIYDAEDRPEPDQLKKAVLAFRKVATDVACVQAKLNYWNRDQNALTRLFTAEYSQHFDLILPGLDATNAPIPLGGTSNHFPVETVLELQAWDPFNVTEDADLGMRLARARLRTAIIESTTFEEANSRPHNWIRQRSRWVKGYMQTWLVHMRHPVVLARDLGPVNWLSFQLIIAGTFVTLLLNPIYWGITILWLLTRAGLVREIFPGFVYFAGSFNLLVGNFLFIYLNLAGLLRRHYDHLVKWALLSPLYWLLMSFGAWKGLFQLFRRPTFWEKTMHGLARS